MWRCIFLLRLLANVLEWILSAIDFTSFRMNGTASTWSWLKKLLDNLTCFVGSSSNMVRTQPQTRRATVARLPVACTSLVTSAVLYELNCHRRVGRNQARFVEWPLAKLSELSAVCQSTWLLARCTGYLQQLGYDSHSNCPRGIKQLWDWEAAFFSPVSCGMEDF